MSREREETHCPAAVNPLVPLHGAMGGLGSEVGDNVAQTQDLQEAEGSLFARALSSAAFSTWGK